MGYLDTDSLLLHLKAPGQGSEAIKLILQTQLVNKLNHSLGCNLKPITQLGLALGLRVHVIIKIGYPSKARTVTHAWHKHDKPVTTTEFKSHLIAILPVLIRSIQPTVGL